jgi:2-oxo-3-hexenedioate decarboxylase
MDIGEVAGELSSARMSRRQLVPPSRRDSEFSIEDGYAVGNLLHQGLVDSGWVPVGLKLGFTNQAVWGELGLDAPFWAPIYDRTVTDRSEVSLEGLVAPRIEPEIVLGFRADLQAGSTSAEVRAAIGWAALGFEIVQCHYPDWEMAPADAVADAGLHGVLVVGEHCELGVDGGGGLANVEVLLRRGSDVVARGRGSAALGGPAEAVAWLLRLPGVEGLPAGTIVTTGTLTAAFPVGSDESWQMSAAGPVALNELKVSFS